MATWPSEMPPSFAGTCRCRRTWKPESSSWGHHQLDEQSVLEDPAAQRNEFNPETIPSLPTADRNDSRHRGVKAQCNIGDRGAAVQVVDDVANQRTGINDLGGSGNDVERVGRVLGATGCQLFELDCGLALKCDVTGIATQR